MTELDYELRDDGVLYTLVDGTRVKVGETALEALRSRSRRGMQSSPRRPVTWEDPSFATGW